MTFGAFPGIQLDPSAHNSFKLSPIKIHYSVIHTDVSGEVASGVKQAVNGVAVTPPPLLQPLVDRVCKPSSRQKAETETNEAQRAAGGAATESMIGPAAMGSFAFAQRPQSGPEEQQPPILV